MSEYLDYDEAVRANRARKKKAMAMKRKRQAQIRLIKRNLFAAILLLVISVVVTKSVKAISSRADDSNAQQQAVLTDNVIEDNNITVIQQESVFKCAAKSPDYKEMLDGDIQSPYVALLDVTNNQLIAGKQAVQLVCRRLLMSLTKTDRQPYGMMMQDSMYAHMIKME